MIQSLDKALNILSLFTSQRPELTLMEIVEHSGLQKSSVYKILQTFVANDYLSQDPASKKYRLGNRIPILSNAFFKTSSITTLLHEKLQNAANATGENLYYAVPNGTEILYLDAATSASTVIEPSSRGAVAPMSCTALGKAMLAFSDAELRNKVISMGLVGATKNSITDPNAYIAELEEIRRRGYAIDDMEHVYGIVCVAVPICKGKNAIGAISISGPSLRFPEEKIKEYAALLTDIKKQAELYV